MCAASHFDVAPGRQKKGQDRRARPCRLKPAPKVGGETGNWEGREQRPQRCPPPTPHFHVRSVDLTTARSVWVIPAAQRHARLGTAGKPMLKVSISLASCDDGGAMSQGKQAALGAQKAGRQIP